MTTSTPTRAIKNAEISAQILARTTAGATPQQAFDAVLGEGAYRKMADDLYDSLRAKAAANNADLADVYERAGLTNWAAEVRDLPA